MRVTPVIAILALACQLTLANQVTKSLDPTPPSEFKCNDDKGDHVVGDKGFLIIDRSKPTCEFKGQDDTKVFGIRTDDIHLKAGDTLTISTAEQPTTITFKAPLEPGYILSGLVEPVIKFKFAKTDNSTMRAEFIQNKADISIDGDNFNLLRINPTRIQEFNLSTVKTIDNNIHLELIGGKGFTHSLMTNSAATRQAQFDNDRTIVVKSGPVLNSCSGSFQTKDEMSYQVVGPDPKTADNKYKCVNIFDITGDRGHFEVDLANLPDTTDIDDELLLDDGISKVKITRQQAMDFSKQLLVFNGKNLAVVYNSPRNVSRKLFPYKITVSVKFNGGILDKSGQLSAIGRAHYVLRPQPYQFAILLTKGQLKGVDMLISTKSATEFTKIPQGLNLPPVIASNQLGAEMIVDFVDNTGKNSKLESEIIFNSTSLDCNGIVYGDSGSITVLGGPKTCYWYLGAARSYLTMDSIDLGLGGCLEIYSLTKKDPILKKCDIKTNEILPGLLVDQGYLKLQLTSNTSQLIASVKPVVAQHNQISSLNRVNITSRGYPSSYDWSTASDKFNITSVNKTMLLSIEDLDVRTGESMLVDNKEIKAISSIVGDLDISNKTETMVALNRKVSDDLKLHRGYKLVVTEFEQLLVADVKKNSITSRANLTSLLLKVEAPQGQRIQYNITTKSAISKDARMSILDDRSILGREVYGDERDHGSTTSNTLLISLLPTTKTTTTTTTRGSALMAALLPVIDVQYKFIQCNKTLDHVCDNDTRCVPVDKLCKGKSYCLDETDLRISCSSGPAPNPKIIERGVGGVAVFLLCTIMFVFGAISALYGPDIFRSLETRFRSGQYTTFTSTE